MILKRFRFHQRDIQRAHDILHFLSKPAAPVLLNREGAIAASAAHDALAWVLGFPCGERFGDNLGRITEEILRRGYVGVELGELITDDEARKRGL